MLGFAAGQIVKVAPVCDRQAIPTSALGDATARLPAVKTIRVSLVMTNFLASTPPPE